ncbi:MAG: 50S ribosomal protein L30 [Candidatus Altiarchaeota archaeon]
MSKALAAIRVRGSVHVKRGQEDAMKYVGLTRKNHCTILFESKEVKGTIAKFKDQITWGEVDDKTIAQLLKVRGRITGDKNLTDSYVKENSKYADIDSLAKALAAGEAKFKDVKGLKRVFRLSPPRKGFERKGIKKPYTLGGALGYRGDKIKDLIGRML